MDVQNGEEEMMSIRLVIRWRVCIDYKKMNNAIIKDHYSLPFIHQFLERLAVNGIYCFLVVT